MRKVKFIIWFFIIFILQTVCSNYFSVKGVSPDFVIGFAVCVVIMEDSFSVAVLCGILCGVLSGALLGKNFSFTVLAYTYFTVILFALRRKPLYFPNFFKVLIYTAIISLIYEAGAYLVLYRAVSWFIEAFFTAMLPASVYNVIAAAVIYPIAKRTLFKTDTRKKLLVV